MQSEHKNLLSRGAEIAQSYQIVREKLAQSARDYARQPEDVTLVAVSKTMPEADILPVLAAGHHVFGENRVQEAQNKWPNLRKSYKNVELHLIGPLQTNKVKEAITLFDVIETLDREKLAAALAEEAQKGGKLPQLYVQVNTGAEPQKAGILPQEADEFIAKCRNDYGLTLAGLMCIPPADAPPSAHFALLRLIGERNGLKILSMGMSADYDAAIQLGATHVRLGSAIFGARV